MKKRKRAQMPTQTQLLNVLSYNPSTGSLTWKVRPESEFSAKAHAAAWNAKNANKPALTANSTGYRAGTVFGKAWKAHRIIWMMMTGEIPDCIDHIDGDRQNNKWSNLRNVSRVQNNRNSGRRSNNTSGHVGVTMLPKTGRWRAQAKMNGKYYYFGTFGTLEEAIKAREAGARQLGFHENHGRARDTMEAGDE